MREIKRRKTSIQSTAQITKAMKLVSTVKFQKAKSRAESTRTYFDKMYNTMNSILSKAGNIRHRYLMPADASGKAVIVITSDRGLAGGYNSNIEKLVSNSQLDKADVRLYTVGRKGRDMLTKKGYTLARDFDGVIDNPTFRAAQDIGRSVLDAYSNGEVGEIWMAYTSFKNTITHIPRLIRLLPVEVQDEESVSEGTRSGPQLLMNFEPNPEEVLDELVPKYINSLIYGAMMEASASENGARMTAMDNATSNAEEMIEDLTLSYNRARQGAITQEITEIVSGSEALK